MENRGLADLIVAATALYGAVLSTYTLVRQNKNKKPSIKVSISTGFVTDFTCLGPVRVMVTAANDGHVPVMVVSWAIRLPDKTSLVVPGAETSRTLPVSLAPGENCTMWVDRDDVVQKLIKIGYSGRVPVRAVVSDAIGNKFYSKTIKLDTRSCAS